LQNRLHGLARWFQWVEPQQVSHARKLLAELPLGVVHADGALPLFLDRFDALLPGCKLNLILGDMDFGPTRKILISECHTDAACPWRAVKAGPMPLACTTCRKRGVQRLVCVLPDEGDQGKGFVLLDTTGVAGRYLRLLLQDAAHSLGVAVQLLRHQRESQRKQATFQHGALARELHDSVAQQLGYLSFQARLIQSQMSEPEVAAASLAELSTGLSQLQRQVRELITSARLTMDGRSLRQALADSVAEFSRRCIIVFELDNRLADDALSPATELQVLQIIREALTNAVRHSHARHVRIELRQDQEGDASISVEDDGIGLSPASEAENHFGLAIIRERASAIGARLSIEPIRPHGVRVHLGLSAFHADTSGSFDVSHDLVTDR
jgi:two-component system nitrate/nitrite sensor histidine kinase NarX